MLGRYSKELFKSSDLTFFWGANQHKVVKKNMPSDADFLITGHPRFELLKPKFHQIYEDDINLIKSQYKNFILINTNMGFGNNIKGDAFVISNYGSRFKNIKKIIDFDKKKLEVFKSMILELSKTKKTIIIRPHPEEDKSFYLNEFKEFSNVHTIYDGSVIPWLLSADIMIHPDCTTAIEYYFIGKQPISYLPRGYPENLTTKLPLEISKCFTEKNKIVDFINNAEKKIYDNKNIVIENSFSFSKPSTNLIVNKINMFNEDTKSLNQKNFSMYLIILLKLKSLKSKFFIKNNINKLSVNKLKGLSFEKIKLINKKFAELDSSYKQVEIKKINSSLFSFSAKRTD